MRCQSGCDHDMGTGTIEQRETCKHGAKCARRQTRRTYRYYAQDFERRWQKRLGAAPPRGTGYPPPLHVKVTHHFRPPNRYSWELRPTAGVAVEESDVQFASWEEASKAGNLALKQFLTNFLKAGLEAP